MNDAPSLPCVQMLVGTTIALMTSFARPNEQARVAPGTLRRLMARKIVSNLFFLKEHPEVAGQLRQVLRTAHGLWSELAEQLEGLDEADEAEAQERIAPRRQAEAPASAVRRQGDRARTVALPAPRWRQ